MIEGVRLITQYIRENRHIYTRAAIDHQLLERGYTPDDIASAWEIIEVSAEAYGSVPQGKSVFKSSSFWGSIVGFVLTLYLVPFTLGSFFPGLSLQLPLAGAVVIAAILGAIFLRDYSKPASFGLLTGVVIGVFVIPLSFYALIFGICLLTFPNT